jgi:predicted mannosyl-3-phosphoglycerate phosphatase (HAD superfamily)
MANTATDVPWLDEPEPNMPPISGRKAHAQRQWRRLSTSRGRFPWWPNDGLDIRDFLLSKQEVSFIERAIRDEAEKDEECDEAAVEVIREGPRGDMTINISIDDGDGPFDFTLLVSQARTILVENLDAG